MICESSGFSDEWEKIIRVQHIKIIFSVSMLIVLQEIYIYISYNLYRHVVSYYLNFFLYFLVLVLKT